MAFRPFSGEPPEVKPLPQVLEPYYELWYCFVGLLKDRVELTHEIPLRDASVK